METQVLQKDNLASSSLIDGLLNLGSNAIIQEGNLPIQELSKLLRDGRQRVLGVDLSIRTAKMGHEDNGLCAIVNGILDGGESSDDTLVVGDVLVGVKGNVKVHADKDPLVLEVHVGDGCACQSQRQQTAQLNPTELVAERHDGQM